MPKCHVSKLMGNSKSDPAGNIAVVIQNYRCLSPVKRHSRCSLRCRCESHRLNPIPVPLIRVCLRSEVFQDNIQVNRQRHNSTRNQNFPSSVSGFFVICIFYAAHLRHNGSGLLVLSLHVNSGNYPLYCGMMR